MDKVFIIQLLLFNPLTQNLTLVFMVFSRDQTKQDESLFTFEG